METEKFPSEWKYRVVLLYLRFHAVMRTSFATNVRVMKIAGTAFATLGLVATVFGETSIMTSVLGRLFLLLAFLSGCIWAVNKVGTRLLLEMPEILSGRYEQIRSQGARLWEHSRELLESYADSQDQKQYLHRWLITYRKNREKQRKVAFSFGLAPIVSLCNYQMMQIDIFLQLAFKDQATEDMSELVRAMQRTHDGRVFTSYLQELKINLRLRAGIRPGEKFFEEIRAKYEALVS